MDIMSLDSLAQEVGGKIPPIQGIGGIMVDPEGFVMMNVKIPCVKGYNEDQIAIIMDDLGMKDCHGGIEKQHSRLVGDQERHTSR